MPRDRCASDETAALRAEIAEATQRLQARKVMAPPSTATAPSTVDVRHLHAVLRRHLLALTMRTGVLDGIDTLALVDIDSMLRSGVLPNK